MQVPSTGDLLPIEGEHAEELASAIEELGGVVFHVGEELELKGGKFRVESFGRKFIRLRGLPGTRIAQARPGDRTLEDEDL